MKTPRAKVDYQDLHLSAGDILLPLYWLKCSKCGHIKYLRRATQQIASHEFCRLGWRVSGDTISCPEHAGADPESST